MASALSVTNTNKIKSTENVIEFLNNAVWQFKFLEILQITIIFMYAIVLNIM